MQEDNQTPQTNDKSTPQGPPAATAPDAGPMNNVKSGQMVVGGRRSRRPLIWLLVLLLIASAAYGGYWYANRSTDTSSSSKSSVTSKSSSSPVADGTHFVQSSGYPFDTVANPYGYTTKLGVPGFLQAVRVTSSSGNTDPAFEAFDNGLFNNELARIVIGDPTSPDTNGAGISGISLSAITGSWLNSQAKQDMTDYGFGAINTPAEKQKYIADLKTKTAACVKDAKKGFAFQDGSINVCVDYEYGQMGYSPAVWFSGYGEVQGQKIVLSGHVDLPDDSPNFGSIEQAQKAVANAKAGHPTAKTATQQKALIDALKQSTVTAQKRSS